MNRYTIKGFKYEADSPMARLQEFEDKIENGVLVGVRHGRWIYNPDGTDWGIGAWFCSLCRGKNANLGIDNTFSPYLYAGSKFCPECGAKMDGGYTE